MYFLIYLRYFVLLLNSVIIFCVFVSRVMNRFASFARTSLFTTKNEITASWSFSSQLVYNCIESEMLSKSGSGQGRTQGSIKGFIPQKLLKLDLTTGAEYVANLVHVMCGCKRATVQFST